MKNNNLLYKDFEEISLEEIEENYDGFRGNISANGSKVLMNNNEKIEIIASHF